MRILHVLNHTGRLNGHVNAAVDLACTQVQLGHQVTVASAGGSMEALLVANSVEIVHVNQRRHPLTAAAAVVKLTRLIRRNHFDVVHAHMMTSAVLCWPACRLTRVPLVTTVHNEFEPSAVAMRVGQRVIGVSGAVASSMIRRGISPARVRTVLNGTIGTPRYAGSPGPPEALGPASILFVGGLHPRKGFLDLLEAFHVVVATVPGATLHVVGEGPCESEYKAAAASGPSAGAITFHGGIDDPRPWYLGADVFVLPSRAEPAGLVLSEACEAGCAIVASNVGGIPEMLDGGRAGILVPPGSPARLAAAVTKLLTDPNCLQQGKRRARANVPRMSLARVAQETMDVYRECMSRQGS